MCLGIQEEAQSSQLLRWLQDFMCLEVGQICQCSETVYKLHAQSKPPNAAITQNTELGYLLSSTDHINETSSTLLTTRDALGWIHCSLKLSLHGTSSRVTLCSRTLLREIAETPSAFHLLVTPSSQPNEGMHLG